MWVSTVESQNIPSSHSFIGAANNNLTLCESNCEHINYILIYLTRFTLHSLFNFCFTSVSKMFRAPSPTPSDMKEVQVEIERNFNWLQLKCLIFEILHIAGTPPRALQVKKPSKVQLSLITEFRHNLSEAPHSLLGWPNPPASQIQENLPKLCVMIWEPIFSASVNISRK